MSGLREIQAKFFKDKSFRNSLLKEAESDKETQSVVDFILTNPDFKKEKAIPPGTKGLEEFLKNSETGERVKKPHFRYGTKNYKKQINAARRENKIMRGAPSIHIGDAQEQRYFNNKLRKLQRRGKSKLSPRRQIFEKKRFETEQLAAKLLEEARLESARLAAERVLREKEQVEKEARTKELLAEAFENTNLPEDINSNRNRFPYPLGNDNTEALMAQAFNNTNILSNEMSKNLKRKKEIINKALVDANRRHQNAMVSALNLVEMGKLGLPKNSRFPEIEETKHPSKMGRGRSKRKRKTSKNKRRRTKRK